MKNMLLTLLVILVVGFFLGGFVWAGLSLTAWLINPVLLHFGLTAVTWVHVGAVAVAVGIFRFLVVWDK